jgi:hypothetical protein
MPAAADNPALCCYRERLRANPSLVNCCTIDWFQAWPSDALEAVAKKQLREVADLDATTQKKLVAMCQAMHVQVGCREAPMCMHVYKCKCYLFTACPLFTAC